MDYYSTVINENHSHPRCLFFNFDKLFHRKAENRLPQANDPLQMLLLTFFINKILNIREELQLERNTMDDHFPEPLPYEGIAVQGASTHNKIM